MMTDDAKTTKADLANKLKSNCDEIQVLAVSHDNHTAYIIDAMVFDRYDCEISVKQLERDRHTGRETTPTYVSSGRRRVPAYREFMKNATNKSALAEFICVYLTDTAPQFLKEHQ